MSSSRCFVFDLDGTLFDTRDLVRAAYLEAGVEMPENAWGKPWHVWLKDKETHTQKNIAYQRLLATSHVPELPPLDVVRELLARGEDTYILTGASWDAARALIEQAGIANRVKVLGWSATQSRKRSQLWKMHTRKGRPFITYVDDDDAHTVVPKYNALFVRYTGQTSEQLKEDMGWT